MSRYINVDTLTFTDINDNSYPVKDVRDIEEFTTKSEINVTPEDLLDEIATRDEAFGNNGEFQSWKIFDANIIKLTEKNFVIGNIKKLKIPL